MYHWCHSGVLQSQALLEVVLNAALKRQSQNQSSTQQNNKTIKHVGEWVATTHDT
jgi:hypothetical protein